MASASEAQRDGNLLQHISRYCEDAMDAAKQAGSEALFMDSRLYQHAVAMCILEIGELAKHLSEGFLQEHAEIIRCVIRAHDRIADRSPRNRKPGGKVFILRPTGGKIQAGSLQSTSMGR